MLKYTKREHLDKSYYYGRKSTTTINDCLN